MQPLSPLSLFLGIWLINVIKHFIKVFPRDLFMDLSVRYRVNFLMGFLGVTKLLQHDGERVVSLIKAYE